MIFRKQIRSIRDWVQNTKNSLKIPTKFLAAKRQGDISKRLNGLDEILSRCNGKSILDIGCYDGLIAYEFGRFGAVTVDGIDNDPYHLDTATRIFTQIPTNSNFIHRNLQKGIAPLLSKNGGPLQKRYDIVCFLGVYQHIYKGMTVESKTSLLEAIVDLTEESLVIRLPAHTWVELEKYFDQSMLEEIERTEQIGTVGEIRIYRRISAS